MQENYEKMEDVLAIEEIIVQSFVLNPISLTMIITPCVSHFSSQRQPNPSDT